VVTPKLPIPEPASAVIEDASPERIGVFAVALVERSQQTRTTAKKDRPMIDQQLREACREYGSQYALSKASGIDQSLLSRFLNGYDIRLQSAAALAEFLGLELRAKGKAKKRG